MTEHTGTNDDDFPPPAETTNRAPHLEYRWPDTLILNSAAEDDEVFDYRILPEDVGEPLPEMRGTLKPDVTPRIDVVYRLAEHLPLSSPLFDTEVPDHPSRESTAQRDERYFLAAIRAYVARYLGCGTSAVEPDKTFVDLGFDSLSLLELREWFGPDFALDDTLPIAAFFEHRTPAALARYLSKALDAREAPDQDDPCEISTDVAEPAPSPERHPTAADVPTHQPQSITDKGKKTRHRWWRSARLWKAFASAACGVTSALLWLLEIGPGEFWFGVVLVSSLLTIVLTEFSAEVRRTAVSLVGFVGDKTLNLSSATGHRRRAQTQTRDETITEVDSDMP